MAPQIYYDELKAQGIINQADSFVNAKKFDTLYLDGVISNAGGNVGAHYGKLLRRMVDYMIECNSLSVPALSNHDSFGNSSSCMIQNIELTENFPCYDFVRMININERFDTLSAKHIAANDGTNNDLIKAILIDLMRIYWKHRFNTDHPINLTEAREELRKA